MSLNTDTWSELRASVEAKLCKVLTTNELKWLQTNLNTAIKRIYDASAWWERYLVVSEPRAVVRGDIAFTEESFYVYGAGTEEVNGLYERNGNLNGDPKYTLFDSDGTSELWNIGSDAATQWGIIVGDDNTSLTPGTTYYTNTYQSTPPLSGWTTESPATAPGPLLVDVAEIGTVLLVNRYDMVNDGGYCPLSYNTSTRGITLHNYDDDRIAYVTYKKPLTTKYGDGTGGTSTAIPEEWLEYAAYYCARAMQIGMRQSNDSPYAVISSREVDEAKQDALMKLEEQGISNTVAKRIQTHLQYNTQL